ncbi:phosphopantetheine-binding protein [Nocardioides sp. Bht2]|uniref:phosphopantetheine-binding protein n=1 Tax=Nocardioides sp. Bht2 TaxID=3392297 RepID=UPI0039B596D7
MTAQPENILALIGDFLLRASKPQEELSATTSLWADGLELDSLEAAELSAMLEDAYGSDPFSVGATMPETVADVLAFYEAPATA